MTLSFDPNSDATDSYDLRYLKGIAQFNECEFFDAHDTWEELWAEYRGPSRKFYQGLIQAAVALYHFGNGNLHGAKKVYHSSRNYLQEYQPLHEGINLETFLAEYERCFAELIGSVELLPGVKPPILEIDPERIPEIHLESDTS